MQWEAGRQDLGTGLVVLDAMVSKGETEQQKPRQLPSCRQGNFHNHKVPSAPKLLRMLSASLTMHQPKAKRRRGFGVISGTSLGPRGLGLMAGSRQKSRCCNPKPRCGGSDPECQAVLSGYSKNRALVSGAENTFLKSWTMRV